MSEQGDRPHWSFVIVRLSFFILPKKRDDPRAAGVVEQTRFSAGCENGHLLSLLALAGAVPVGGRRAIRRHRVVVDWVKIGARVVARLITGVRDAVRVVCVWIVRVRVVRIRVLLVRVLRVAAGRG